MHALQYVRFNDKYSRHGVSPSSANATVIDPALLPSSCLGKGIAFQFADTFVTVRWLPRVCQWYEPAVKPNGCVKEIGVLSFWGDFPEGKNCAR